MSYTLTIEESVDGDLYIRLPDELLTSMGWQEGTELTWLVEDDGTIILKENK